MTLLLNGLLGGLSLLDMVHFVFLAVCVHDSPTLNRHSHRDAANH